LQWLAREEEETKMGGGSNLTRLDGRERDGNARLLVRESGDITELFLLLLVVKSSASSSTERHWRKKSSDFFLLAQPTATKPKNPKPKNPK
jgi:hypothetical protein